VTGEERDLARILDPPAAPEGCPTAWTLQRHALDELKGDEWETVASHVAQCERCRQELATLDNEREAFLTERPFAVAEADISERAVFLPDDPEVEVQRPFWSQARGAAAALAAGAAAAVVTTLLVTGGVGEAPPLDRVKGVTDLQAALLRDGKVVRVEPGLVARPGDEIQFRVDTADFGHVIVLGVDGTGEISVYQPLDGGVSVAVEPGAGRTLDPAFRLDDAPGPEVYVALFTAEPIASRDATAMVGSWVDDGGVEAVAAQTSTAAFDGAVEVLTLDKEAPAP